MHKYATSRTSHSWCNIACVTGMPLGGLAPCGEGAPPRMGKTANLGEDNKHTRGDQKVLGLTHSSVQNKIKIVFASYSSKAQNTTCAL